VVNRGENGLWLRYTWYFGDHAVGDVNRLAVRLERHGIRDAFFHVRGIGKDGHLTYRCLIQAKTLNQSLHKLARKVRRIAWIYAGNSAGGGRVDLRSDGIRHSMAAEAAWLVNEAGFDGVQWDYEICPDRDPNFLRLLEETRAALPKGAYLGTDVPGWYPMPLSGVGWSETYYREVARRCDCLAVMAYDSGMPTPHSYVWWVSEQTVRITRAAAQANNPCRVLMGIPTYKEPTRSHNPYAENLRLALIGVRRGLAANANRSAWQGVSIFADYTTDEKDWQTFDRLWPGDGKP